MTDMSSVLARAIWSDDEMLECVSIIPEMANFTFRAPSGAFFDFLPGQFLTLEIPAPSGTVHRTNTISPSPSRPRSISITAKAQTDSIGTRWMLDNLAPGVRIKLAPGVRIKAFGPAALFSHLNHEAEKYLFISAGSGITPMMSMTTFMFDLGSEPDVVFVNCARRPAEIIFREQLEHMASRVPGINLKWVVETPDRYAPWIGYQWQFNQLMLGLMAPDYLEPEVFCCGLEPFMQAVREALQGLGYDMGRYHQESFQAPVETEADAPALDDVIPDEDTRAEVTFSASCVTAKVAETETILAAARANGLNIPSG